jgi:hypothetical protein
VESASTSFLLAFGKEHLEVFIVKGVKVVCFDRLLQVFILNELSRVPRALIFPGLREFSRCLARASWGAAVVPVQRCLGARYGLWQGAGGSGGDATVYEQGLAGYVAAGFRG